MAREINATESRSDIDGGCNGCTDHNQPGAKYRIWKIDLRAVSIRLCDDCMTELMDKSKTAFRNAK